MALALGTSLVSGQSVTLNTIPQGALTITLPSTLGSAPYTSLLTLPLTSAPTYTGTVTTVTASGSNGSDTISVSNPPSSWTMNSLANLYFVKFITGQETGRVVLVTANTTSSLTLDTSDHSGQTTNLSTANFTVNIGDSFEVFPADTLASLFGDNSSNLLLTEGATVYSADTVGIYFPSLGRWETFFFSTGTGQWEEQLSTGATDTNNENNTVIFPYSGFKITRNSNEAALTFPVMGRVPEVPILTKNPGNGTTVYASSGYPVDFQLTNLDLGTNWISSPTNNAAAVYFADTIGLWNPTIGRFDTYYRYVPSGTTNYTWRKSNDSIDAQDTNMVYATNMLQINEINTNAIGVASFIHSAMPYTVDTNSF